MIVQPTGDDVVAGQIANGRFSRSRPLDLAAIDKPVDLAGDVVVDLAEAQRFEPAPGSCTEVSEGVPAVDDHRPLPVER